MKDVEFHPAAQDEFVSAARFYEAQSGGLGLDFIVAVHRAYERVREFPSSGRRVGRRLRRLLVPRFPYGLVRRVEPTRIYIRGSDASSPAAWLSAVTIVKEPT